MNKNIETTKIKVNNGQELIAKAQEYKNSGGEWKLLERYIELPDGENDKEYLNWGIIISNGNEAANIYAENEGRKTVNAVSEYDSRNELIKIFPEYKHALFNYGGGEGKNASTCKAIKEKDGDCRLYRYLVAEKFWDLEKIIENYFRENEAKIYNSPNREFSDWVEIIDGQDGNIYLYVGEKKENGGREVKVGIKKETFDKKETERLKERGKYFSGSEILETDWRLYIMSSDQPLTPAQQKKYFSSNGGLEEYWQTVERNWEQACRTTLEALYEQLLKAQNFWDDEIGRTGEDKTEEIRKLSRKIGKVYQRLEQMKKEYPDWYYRAEKICSECGEKMCCWHEKGQRCKRGGKNHSPSKNPLLSHDFLNSGPSNPKNSQLKDSEKSQILSYFLAKNISKISLENGKLVIEYSDNSKKTVENEDQEQKKYRQLIQNLPNQSLSLSELKSNDSANTSPSSNNDSNKNLYKGLAVGIIGGVVLIGLIAWIVRKKSARKKS